MRLPLILVLAASTSAYAQESGNVVYQTQNAGPGPVTIAAGAVLKGPMAQVKGAPYSATITNESVQTLADGNRIVQTSTGTTARDSQGRTRQDTVLPAIGNLSAADAPHLVFIQDPVAGVSYTLNLTDKTAQKMTMPPMPAGEAGSSASVSAGTFFIKTEVAGAAASGGPLPAPPPPMVMQKLPEQFQASTDDLGSQTMEGVVVNGVRTTRTIPAGEIGNDKPIVIVTEVWTSPDLKTIVSSKRSDPRMGEQTFQLTNLVRAEPDATLFVVPPDFKMVDGPQPVIYRSNR
jgi:hypothetical protein